MKLPNGAFAVIEPAKLIQYLLNPEHTHGGSKARVLISLGYSAKEWRRLKADLLQIAVALEVDAAEQTTWGTRYEIVGPLGSSSGKNVAFRTIWQIDLGTENPRLITMYPE